MTTMKLKSEMLRWGASLVLLIPMLAMMAAHYWNASPPETIATGFVQFDIPSYMANAREVFDEPPFTGTYGNPHSYAPQTPKIYFQPLTLLIGAILKVTGLGPGIVLNIWAVVAGLVMIRLALAVMEGLFGLQTGPQRWAALCFVWGGGLFVLAGILYSVVFGKELQTHLFIFDASSGWWLLNLGRNTVYPTEASYHAMALACILLMVRERYLAGLLMAALLSCSHPFTGLQYGLIVFGWLFLERFYIQRRTVPIASVLAAGGIIAGHIAYYLGFMARFPEHASVMEQWAIAWDLEGTHMLGAYCLVGALVLWRCRNIKLATEVFSQPRNRLLLVAFLVSIVLSNHEAFMRPRQPIHFARGHIWMHLFLLGAPVLIALFTWLGKQRLGWLFVGGVLGIFLSDNVVWFAARSYVPVGTYLSQDMIDTLDWINEHADGDTLLVTDKADIAYMATCYTPARSWRGTRYNTPYAKLRDRQFADFLEHDIQPKEWEGREILLISAPDGKAWKRLLPDAPNRIPGEIVFKRPTFIVQRFTPDN